MERAESESRLERLVTIVREEWGARDADAEVRGTLHGDGKADITVISQLFADKDGLEREAFFWPAFESVPKSELIYMTYCLLLTPEEAERHFSGSGANLGTDNVDSWT